MKNANLNSYCHSAIPEPYTILGVKLLPFSLGHYFLMARFDCGFIDEDPERRGDFTDFLLAVAICSRTYEQFIEFIKDEKEFNKWCRAWGNHVKRLLKDNKVDILGKLLEFKQYMKHGLPNNEDIKYWNTKESDDAKKSGAHWTQALYTTLISKCGYTDDKALNGPMAKAMWDYLKYVENEGMIQLMEDWEIEQIKAAEKAEGVKV
jgi:hypothetical protein